LLTSNNQCSIVVTVTYVLAHATSTGQYSSYVPHREKVLRGQATSSKRLAIGSRPRVCGHYLIRIRWLRNHLVIFARDLFVL